MGILRKENPVLKVEQLVKGNQQIRKNIQGAAAVAKIVLAVVMMTMVRK